MPRVVRRDRLPKVLILQQESTIDAMQVTVATAKTIVKNEAGREVEGLILTCSCCGELRGPITTACR